MCVPAGALWETPAAPRQAEPVPFSPGIYPTAGWLLNLQHLTLGARIGEGEFGGKWGPGSGAEGSKGRGVPVQV